MCDAIPDTGKMTASITVGPHLGAGLHNEQEAVKHLGRDDSESGVNIDIETKDSPP